MTDFRYPYDAGDGCEDLEAPENVYRVLRGGGFASDPGSARCAFRFRFGPDNHYERFGFRVVVRP